MWQRGWIVDATSERLCILQGFKRAHDVYIRSRGWLGEARVSCILRQRGVQLRLAHSWTRPAILVAGKDRGVIFFYFFCFFTFIPVSLSSLSISLYLLFLSLLSLFSLPLGDDTNDLQGLMCRQTLTQSIIEGLGGGWVMQRCRVFYVTGASNWDWLAFGQGLLSLQQVRVEVECFYFFGFFTFIHLPLSPLSLSFISSSISLLPFSGRRHKMTHKDWPVVKPPQHNQLYKVSWTSMHRR